MTPNGACAKAEPGLRARRMEPKGETDTGERLTSRFRALAERLARVVVLNRDWKAAVAPAMLREHGKRETTTAVFLCQSDRDRTSEDATQEAWEWSRWMGEKYRIAYACREGEVEPPKGWETLAESEWTISPDGAGRRGNGPVLAGLHCAPAVPVRAGLLKIGRESA